MAELKPEERDAAERVLQAWEKSAAAEKVYDKTKKMASNDPNRTEELFKTFGAWLNDQVNGAKPDNKIGLTLAHIEKFKKMAMADTATGGPDDPLYPLMKSKVLKLPPSLGAAIPPAPAPARPAAAVAGALGRLDPKDTTFLNDVMNEWLKSDSTHGGAKAYEEMQNSTLKLHKAQQIVLLRKKFHAWLKDPNGAQKELRAGGANEEILRLHHDQLGQLLNPSNSQKKQIDDFLDKKMLSGHPDADPTKSVAAPSNAAFKTSPTQDFYNRLEGAVRAGDASLDPTVKEKFLVQLADLARQDEQTWIRVKSQLKEMQANAIRTHNPRRKAILRLEADTLFQKASDRSKVQLDNFVKSFNEKHGDDAGWRNVQPAVMDEIGTMRIETATRQAAAMNQSNSSGAGWGSLLAGGGLAAAALAMFGVSISGAVAAIAAFLVGRWAYPKVASAVSGALNISSSPSPAGDALTNGLSPDLSLGRSSDIISLANIPLAPKKPNLGRNP